MTDNINYWTKYYDDYIKKHKNDPENLYYFESKEHIENSKKIFRILSEDPDAAVLDAGCGVGYFLIPISYGCKSAYGIDISGETIKLCEEKLAEKKIENVTLKVSSITNIPFDNNSIDKILCFGVLLYLDDEEISTAIREFKRILKKDGVLIINFLNGSSPHGFSTKIIRFVRKLIKGDKKYLYTNTKYNVLKKIIEKENGTLEIFHSAYFYPRLIPESVIQFISNRFYFERFLPKFLWKYGLSISVLVRF